MFWEPLVLHNTALEDKSICQGLRQKGETARAISNKKQIHKGLISSQIKEHSTSSLEFSDMTQIPTTKMQKVEDFSYMQALSTNSGSCTSKLGAHLRSEIVFQ